MQNEDAALAAEGNVLEKQISSLRYEMTNKKLELRSNVPPIAISPQRTSSLGTSMCDGWGNRCMVYFFFVIRFSSLPAIRKPPTP